MRHDGHVTYGAVPHVAVEDIPDPPPLDTVILDVRTPGEWAAGHVPGSLHIPLAALPGRADEVPAARVLVVCHSGSRSAWATAFLRQRGSDAVNLRGGLVAWANAGRPLVGGTGGSPSVD